MDRPVGATRGGAFQPSVRAAPPGYDRDPGGASLVELDLLGTFELRRDGEPVALPQAARRLVAFVAMAGRAVNRLYVAGHLWGDTCEERAAASLRSALWRIRRTGVPVLQVTTSHLRLAPDVRLDVSATAERCQEVVEGDAGADWTRSDLERLRVDLLPDWYDDWVQFDRERLQHLRLATLETLAERLIGVRRLELAVQAAAQAVVAEPLRESARRALIEAHLALGNLSAAAREYRTYCRLLRSELGVGPSPLLEKLADANGLTGSPGGD